MISLLTWDSISEFLMKKQRAALGRKNAVIILFPFSVSEDHVELYDQVYE